MDYHPISHESRKDFVGPDRKMVVFLAPCQSRELLTGRSKRSSLSCLCVRRRLRKMAGFNSNEFKNRRVCRSEC